MKKLHFLTALLALLTLGFVGCPSTGDNKDEILGPRPEDSEMEDGSMSDVDNPPEGERPSGTATFGKFSSIHFDTDSAAIRSSDKAILN